MKFGAFQAFLHISSQEAERVLADLILGYYNNY